MKISKSRNLQLFSYLLLSYSCSSMLSAETRLQLIDGKKFSDYDVTGQSRTKSLVSIQKDFSRLFSKMSESYLSDQQNLEIDVTNVDLPGIFHYSHGAGNRDIRIVDSNARYRLKFNYRVKSKGGDLISEGEHSIKEFLALSSISNRNKNKGTIGYYEKSVKEWFEATFSEKG